MEHGLIPAGGLDDRLGERGELGSGWVGRIVRYDNRRQISIEVFHVGANERETRRESDQEKRYDDDEAGGEAEAERKPHATPT
jgi:hypothetical protein